MNITFDTLEYVNKLKDADVPEKQAQAQAQALRGVLDTALLDHASSLATKEDLRNEIALVRKDLHSEIALVRKDLHGEISLVRKDMDVRFAKVDGELMLLKWMLGFLMAGVASLVLKAYSGA